MSHLYEPENVAQLSAGKWWWTPLRLSSIAAGQRLKATFRVPSRVVAVQHPGGDARQGQSEENQGTEQLQHPPEVASEGASCRRLSRTEKS